jgi:hypothetical protein
MDITVAAGVKDCSRNTADGVYSMFIHYKVKYVSLTGWGLEKKTEGTFLKRFFSMNNLKYLKIQFQHEMLFWKV